MELKVIEEYVDHPTLLEKTSLEEVKEESLILTPYREAVDLSEGSDRGGASKGIQ